MPIEARYIVCCVILFAAFSFLYLTFVKCKKDWQRNASLILATFTCIFAVNYCYDTIMERYFNHPYAICVYRGKDESIYVVDSYKLKDGLIFFESCGRTISASNFTITKLNNNASNSQTSQEEAENAAD